MQFVVPLDELAFGQKAHGICRQLVDREMDRERVRMQISDLQLQYWAHTCPAPFTCAMSNNAEYYYAHPASIGLFQSRSNNLGGCGAWPSSLRRIKFPSTASSDIVSRQGKSDAVVRRRL